MENAKIRGKIIMTPMRVHKYFRLFLLAVMTRHSQISEFEQYVIDYSIRIRTERNFTQQDIANVLKVGRSFVTDVENPKLPKKYNMDHINALADYFGISPKDFFPENPFPV